MLVHIYLVSLAVFLLVWVIARLPVRRRYPSSLELFDCVLFLCSVALPPLIWWQAMVLALGLP